MSMCSQTYTDQRPKQETSTPSIFSALPLYLEVSDSTFDILTVGSVDYRGVKIIDIFPDGLGITDDSKRYVLISKRSIVAIEINEAAKKEKIRGDI